MTPGTRLDAFVIDELLGSGAFGEVYAAHNPVQPSFLYAIKIIKAGIDPQAADWFIREARILWRVESPHVCRVFFVGRTPDDRPYLVMERLHGETLAAVLRRGPLSIAVAVEYTRQICDGLSAVHSHGFVHRDVKPSNIFVSIDAGVARLRLIDFNIARSPDDARHTRTGASPGTGPYMSPEQIAEPETVDHRTDVWAAGAVLFEMIAGVPPFHGATPGAIALAIERRERAEFPADARWIEVIIDRCLTDRDQRFATARDLRMAIDVAPNDSGLPAPSQPARTHAPPTGHGSRAARLLDVLAEHGILGCVVALTLGLLLLLGSFAVPGLNSFTSDGKRVGYVSSFNWTLVYAFLFPAVVVLLGRVLGRAKLTMAELGLTREWDRKASALMILWGVLSALFAVGYTALEWQLIKKDHCGGGGAFYGWGTELCLRAADDILAAGFMWIAAVAQSLLMSAGWLWFSVTVALHDVLLRHADAWRGTADLYRLAELFWLALWGWGALFMSLYLARLWSFHIHTEGTISLYETLTVGLPDRLFEVNVRTQADAGSIMGGIIVLAFAIAPFFVLRIQRASSFGPTLRRVAVFGVVGVFAMVFPRIGALGLTMVAAVTGWHTYRRKTISGH